MLRRRGIPTDAYNKSFASMMRAGVERLRSFQHATGGWGWFCQDADDPFMTACVVHGLSECARLGYAVDRTMLDRGLARLREIAEKEKDPNRLAYDAYVLGEPFERLLKEEADLTPYARALLVLALHGKGRPEAAAQARRLAAEVQGDHWTTKKWYYKWENVDVETTCYAIQALAAVDPGNALIPRATEWLLAQRNGNRWRSTKDTAVAIATLLRVADLEAIAGAVGADAAPEKGERQAVLKRIGVRLNGGAPQELALDLMNPLRSEFEAHLPGVRPGANALAFTALEADADFRFRAEVEIRTFEAGGPPPPAAEGVAVSVAYDRPLEALRIGDEVIATIEVSADEPVDYAMVLSPIPAGCEVIRGSGAGEFTRFEARYEQAIFYLRALGPKPVRLQYRMRCEYAGAYTVLPPWAGLMYDEAVHGTGRTRRAAIRP